MPPPIRVLHLIHHLDIGGAEMALADLLTRFDRTAYCAVAVCMKRGGVLKEPMERQGIPVHVIGKRWGIDAVAVYRLAQILRRRGIDILHTHDFSSTFWGRLAACFAPRTRIVATFHSEAGWHKPIKHRLFGPLLPWPDRIVAVSDNVRHSLVRREAMPADRITVIGNGVCLDRSWAADESRKSTVNVRSSGRRLIGAVGRCSPEKGGLCFVRMAAELVRSGEPVDAVWVGDGPERTAMERLAIHSGLSGRISFAGADLDIEKWLARFDVAVCPSLEEGFGLSALEAQAAGVPVVATRTGGFSSVLRDGKDALLVPPNDADALADAVRRLLHDAALSERLCQAGREKVESEYAIEKTVRLHEALYTDLIYGN